MKWYHLRYTKKPGDSALVPACTQEIVTLDQVISRLEELGHRDPHAAIAEAVAEWLRFGHFGNSEISVSQDELFEIGE